MSAPEPTPPRPRAARYLLVALLVVLLAIPTHVAVPALAAMLAVGAALGAGRAWRRAAASPPGADAFVLGTDDHGKPIAVSDRQLSAHGLILGASGAGKSTTLLAILTGAIHRGLPVVAIDLKGSPAFEAALAAAAAQAGRRFRVWSPDGPARWNPLGHGDATELKDKLIATEHFSEPHYQRAAERYLQTALRVLLEARPERAPSLDDVVRIMEPARLIKLALTLPPSRAEPITEYVQGLTRDQHSAIRGLQTRLALITESHVGPYLAPGGEAVDLRAALAGDDVVLFSLNSSRYGKLAGQLGTIAVQDLVSAVGHRLTQPGHSQAVIGIDEFSALGGDHVLALLARGRESGASVVLATQELADLDRAGRGLRDQVVGNTALKIAHRQDVPGSAAMIAEMAGTEKAWDYTYQLRPGLFGTSDRGRGNRRLVDRFLIHPNEIKRLRTGEGIMITKLPSAQARRIQVRPPEQRGPER